MVGSVHGGTHAGSSERATHNDEPGVGNVEAGGASRTGSAASFQSLSSRSPADGGERPIPGTGNHQGTIGIPLRPMPQNSPQSAINAPAMDTGAGAPAPSQSHAPATGTTGQGPQLGVFPRPLSQDLPPLPQDLPPLAPSPDVAGASVEVRHHAPVQEGIPAGTTPLTMTNAPATDAYTSATGMTGQGPQLGSNLATLPQNTLQPPLSPHSRNNSQEGSSSAGGSGTTQQVTPSSRQAWRQSW